MVNRLSTSTVKVLITAPKKIIQDNVRQESEFICILLRRKVPTGAYIRAEL